MKKILTILILILLMANMSLAVPALPQIVHGKLTQDGFPVKNLDVKVENLDTGTSTTAKTNENGVYQVDLANFDQYYRGSDSVKVTLVYCENLASCSRSEQLKDGGNELSWDLTNVAPFPDETVVVKYACYDGSVVEVQSDCPAKPEPEVIVNENLVVKCENGDEVPSVDDCPEGSSSWWMIVLGAMIAVAADLLAMFGWAKGFTSGLIKYWAKRDPQRAAKMLGTALKKARDGKYKK